MRPIAAVRTPRFLPFRNTAISSAASPPSSRWPTSWWSIPASCPRPAPGMPFSGADGHRADRVHHDAADGPLRAAAVRRGARHGLNAFFAFTIVLQNQVPWQTALGMVFWAGVLFLLVSVTPLRERVAMAIPRGPAAGRRRHRPAADVHRVPQRRAHRGRPGDAACGWARSIIAPSSCCSASWSRSCCCGAEPVGLPGRDLATTALAWTLGYAMPPERTRQPARLLVGRF